MDLDQLRERTRDITLVVSDDYTDNQLDEFINEALQTVAIERPWMWTETEHTFNTVASQQDYTLPTAWQYLQNVTVEGTANQLKQVSRQDGRRLTLDTEAAKATMYTTIGDTTIRLYPTPSTAYEYTVSVHQTPDDLENDDDTPPFNKAFHKILSEYAAHLLFRREEMLTEANQAYSMFLITLDNLERFDKSRVANGTWMPGSAQGR